MAADSKGARLTMSMVRFRIFSDLHLEFADWTPPRERADVIVLAGDIAIGTHGLEWARRHFPDTPVVYVPGNHEFYNAHFPEALEKLRTEARRLGIYFLEGDECIFDGTRFLGTTLWTDYELNGSDPDDVDRAMSDANGVMNDFRMIKWADSEQFSPGLARHMHRIGTAWLAERLAQPFDGPTVVVTHHLPHRRSIHPRWAGTRYNPSFASDLDHLVRTPVSLWVHGHTHDSMDYSVNGTRVVCNPRGYIPREPNVSFSASGIVELNLVGSGQSSR